MKQVLWHCRRTIAVWLTAILALSSLNATPLSVQAAEPVQDAEVVLASASESDTGSRDGEDTEEQPDIYWAEMPRYDAVAGDARGVSTANSYMFVGDADTFSYNAADSYLKNGWSITSYSWSVSGDSAVVTNKTYRSCYVSALTSGRVTLSYYINLSITDWYYVDVQMTQKYPITRNQPFRATWVIDIGEKHVVSLDANGGSVSPSIVEVGCGGEYPYRELPTAARTGYVFDGWYTEKEGGSRITQNSIVSINADHTLYAQWVPEHDYTIHFDGNGSTGGEMEDMRCAYGQSYRLTANGFKRSGHRFVGWSTDKDGVSGTTYSNRGWVSNLCKEDGVFTLYAQWDDANIATGVLDGTNITWVITADGTLIVSGNGEIPSKQLGTGSRWWRSWEDEITAIIVEEEVTGIGDLAFMNTAAVDVKILGNITSLGYSSFSGCSNLESIQLPDSVTYIEGFAFSGCESLKTIELPDSLETIGLYAFDRCSSLKTIELPDSVTNIGESAFEGCYGIEEFRIPASVKYIGTNVFGKMYGLQNIIVDEDNSEYADVDGVLFNKAKTKIFCFPRGHGDVYGDVYVVPDGVTYIDGMSNIKKIIVPATVKTLGIYCFSYSGIQEIYFRGVAPELQTGTLGSYAFDNVTATIYYPTEYAYSWESVKDSYNKAYGQYGTGPSQAELLGKPNLTWSSFHLHNTVADCTVTLLDTEAVYEYDGTEKQPHPVVEDEGVILEEGVDYSLSYRDNINSGTATVIVKGEGGYSGEVEKTFTIRKAQQHLVVNRRTQELAVEETLILEDVSGIGDITYQSSNLEIAEVSDDGVITAKKVGKAVITVRASGDANHDEAEVELEITVRHNLAYEGELSEEEHGNRLFIEQWRIEESGIEFNADSVRAILENYSGQKFEVIELATAMRDGNALIDKDIFNVLGEYVDDTLKDGRFEYNFGNEDGPNVNWSFTHPHRIEADIDARAELSVRDGRIYISANGISDMTDCAEFAALNFWMEKESKVCADIAVVAGVEPKDFPVYPIGSGEAVEDVSASWNPGEDGSGIWVGDVRMLKANTSYCLGNPDTGDGNDDTGAGDNGSFDGNDWRDVANPVITDVHYASSDGNDKGTVTVKVTADVSDKGGQSLDVTVQKTGDSTATQTKTTTNKQTQHTFEFTISGSGEYKITAVLKRKGQTDKSSKTKILIIDPNGKVTVKGDRQGLYVELLDADTKNVYTGSAIKPAIAVYNGDTLLVEGTDYTVKYTNNVKVAESTSGKKAPTITVTGKGKYTGKTITNFTIKPRTLALDDEDMVVGGLLNGTNNTIVVAENTKVNPVLVYKGVLLKAGATGKNDFTVTYPSGNANGKFAKDADAAITITGNNNYKGTLELQLKVVSKSELQKISSVVLDTKARMDYQNKAYDAPITAVKAGKDTVTKENYKIVYSGDRKSAGIQKFTVIGIGYYTGSVTKSFKIQPRKTYLTLTVDADVKKNGSITQTFKSTGVTFNDALTVTDAGLSNKKLVLGKDYKVTYSGNKSVTTNAKYTITFLGNYKGSAPIKDTFTITVANLAKMDADTLELFAADKAYTKPALYKSAPFVQVNGVALKSSDYTVKYYLENPEGNANAKEMKSGNNVSLGNGENSKTVYVAIEGKKNYEGTVYTSFDVVNVGTKKDISKAKVTFKSTADGKTQSKVEYTGGAVYPDSIEIKVGRDNPVTLKPDANGGWDTYTNDNYEVKFVNNIEKGKATAIITGKGANVGSKTATFSVAARNLTTVPADFWKNLGSLMSLRRL